MPALVLPGVFRMRIWLAVAATLFVNVALAQEQGSSPPARELLKPPKKGQVASPITDRFALRVTYFPPTVDTFIRLDQENGQPGTELNAEQDLGLEEKPTMARAEMIIRLRERNRLRVDYFKLTRYGDQVLDQTIVFGDQTFLTNERAQTMIDWRQLGLTYTRSLLYFDKFELGAGLGIALLETRARGEVRARNVRESEDGVAPFPTFALDATWRISKRWSLNVRGQTFTANTDDFDGTLSDYHGDVQYRWRKNFTFGLGYTSLKISAESTSTDDLTGKFDQDISGPEFFIRASF
jgi:hypothetical protein